MIAALSLFIMLFACSFSIPATIMIPNSQLPTVNYQLPILNSQLYIINVLLFLNTAFS